MMATSYKSSLQIIADYVRGITHFSSNPAKNKKQRNNSQMSYVRSSFQLGSPYEISLSTIGLWGDTVHFSQQRQTFNLGCPPLPVLVANEGF